MCGRHPDNEAAPEGCVNGLRSPGLAASRAPRRIVLPSLRADDSSLGIDGDRPPERARLDPGPGLRPHRRCDLITKRRFRRMIVASACFPAENPCRTSTVGAPSTEFPSARDPGTTATCHLGGVALRPSDPVSFQKRRFPGVIGKWMSHEFDTPPLGTTTPFSARVVSEWRNPTGYTPMPG